MTGHADRKAKRTQGFEASPPLCRNCDWFANGGQRPHPQGGLVSHRCTLGEFNVAAFSVCDRWTAKGQTIEPVEGTPA